jgi:hypothetical protein
MVGELLERRRVGGGWHGESIKVAINILHYLE